MRRTAVAGIGLGGLAACVAACVSSAQADGPKAQESWRVVEQAEELGLVRWERDYAQARAQAREHGKPLFVLFQEVPG